MYKRILNLDEDLQKKSHFLFGPRATGKSWLIQHQLETAQVFDLLDIATYDRLLRRPSALGEEIRSNRVVIDEIQKIPRLLDEVHRLIEAKKIHFLLTGSSARKLKHGGANLLAGRARSLHLFPLTSQEISDFDLQKYCNRGGLPLVYQSPEAWLELRDYIHLYLKEEIIAEAIVRKVDHYARFLDVIGLTSGEELNISDVANDSGVPPRTVANFIEILKDTLLAFELLPFQKSKKRKAISKNKLFLFDVGVANYLAGRKDILPRSTAFGKAFEHFLVQEVRAYLGYHLSDLPMQYWRTQGGKYEVDCVLGDQIAIEFKAMDNFSAKSLTGLQALKEEKKIKKYLLVCRDPDARKVKDIDVIPYSQFLQLLWGHELGLR